MKAMDITTLALATISVGLFFNFSNGFHDASNIVATIVSSRSMSIRSALIMASVLVFVGSFFLGTAVAKTIGVGIVNTTSITIESVIAAVAAATAWNILTWVVGLPSSSSHALIGGLMGAALYHSGVSAIEWLSVLGILGVIFVSPILGFVVSYQLTKMNFHLFRHVHPVMAGGVLERLQIFSAALLAVSHGTNDAQKAMGVITLSLVLLSRMDPEAIAWLYTPGPTGAFAVPLWVIFACSFAMSLGMLSGGKRIIRTVGLKLFKIKPIHGFGAMLSTAAVVYLCSVFGFPVSTTHIASSAVVGGGAAQRISLVRWGLTKDILLTWLLTIPGAAALAYLLALLMAHIS
jgi:inorganic phosphate transporter, PiT family